MFAVLARQFVNGAIGLVLVVSWMICSWSMVVNLTDGLDGLTAATTAMMLACYVIIGYWQFRHLCPPPVGAPGCYSVRDPLDVALVAAAGLGGCAGLLWWNAPAGADCHGRHRIVSAKWVDRGPVLTRTELSLIIGGAFVVGALSVVAQFAVFTTTRRRLLRMAPLHHHAELAGWADTTVTIRFWLLAGTCCMAGLAVSTASIWPP